MSIDVKDAGKDELNFFNARVWTCKVDSSGSGSQTTFCASTDSFSAQASARTKTTGRRLACFEVLTDSSNSFKVCGFSWNWAPLFDAPT